MRYLAALILALLLSSRAHAQITPPAYTAFTLRYGIPVGPYAAYPAYYPPAYPGYYGGYGYGDYDTARELRLLRWDFEDAQLRRQWRALQPRRY